MTDYEVKTGDCIAIHSAVQAARDEGRFSRDAGSSGSSKTKNGPLLPGKESKRHAMLVPASRRAYSKARVEMEVGDLIGFHGDHVVSRVIAWKTEAPFSHVATVIGKDSERGPIIVESTMIGEGTKDGIQRNYLDDRVGSYRQLYWLRLAKPTTLHGTAKRLLGERAVLAKIYFMIDQGVGYDTLGAIRSSTDVAEKLLGKAFEQNENFDRLFCSELCAYILKMFGVLPASLNCSEVTPADMLNFKCWSAFHLLKGDDQGLKAEVAR